MSSAASAHYELLQSLDGFVAQQLELLLPIDRAWQPNDHLPDLTAEDWRERVETLRSKARGLSDEVLVGLVGATVTEEALPSYSVSLNLIAQDHTGTSDRAWARWLRGWTAEENRHGDLLNAYLRLSGRVDMLSVERTIHHLLAGGFNPKTYPDAYGGLIYPSFQERATRISHANLGQLAADQGDDGLAGMCRRIASDESRHETFYARVMGRVFQEDPSGAVLSMKAVLRSIIVMPGALMNDGNNPHLFENFASVAQRSGVYTARDYAAIIEHLVTTWGVRQLSVSGEAARAQEFLCRQPERYASLAGLLDERLAQQPRAAFGWIFGRTA